MRVLIAYNEPVLLAAHPDAGSEREIIDVVNAVEPHLLRAGCDSIRLGVGREFTAFRDVLRFYRPDVVLNLFEGFGDEPSSECDFAQLLECENVAFTGASSRTLWNAGRKDVAKCLIQRADLATPAFIVVNNLPLEKCGLRWPVIVKPAFRDASCGIRQASVVTNEQQLANRINETAREYGFPILVEEFIEGREISVAIFDWLDLTVLPAVETAIYTGDGDWSIVSYDAKWQPGSRDHDAIELRYPADMLPHQAARIATMARNVYQALDCNGFATIDLRLTDDDKLYVLELNPNGDLKPSDCLVESLQSIGITYTNFIAQMVHTTRTRFAEAAAVNRSA